MAKQLNVNLAFTADTGKAKAQLKDLQNQLTQVINLSSKDIGGEVMAQDIEKASLAAAQLKAHLEDATNVKTGKLDLGKLSEALDTRKLKAYRNSLQAIGVEGQKAFMMLAQSITDAEVPLRRTSNMMNELWVTMKNTMRWQFTSSAMHGFMSAVSGAYGYAQDLNESLNNIRIVSGQSAEEMAKFAVQANKAAKALSTTTTDYTNAALIYYQQGLSDSEIKERTEITIKMANVARQSAEIVSDQLTAVWNNFYKEGDKALVYYADIMTALGAETASSTDEIAAGLEKFASIADMIGLSFEYAASSLATITATTRQSPEVVGTALKTIFARIQGLKLGETLEDGTDLNKYSDSLKRVGIDIFDTTGELKDMDIVLEEIGARWDSLATSEQVALAQAVAGVRQYNQLVSLMDNWDYFQENLGTARASEGALDEQAKIYEESWEAARDRVRAAMESIYSDIIKDEAFIDMLNNIEGIVRGIDKLIDSIGGLGGILSALGLIATKVFHDQMSAGLRNFAYSMDMTFGLGRERTRELQKAAWKETEKFEADDATFEGTLKGDLIREQSALQQAFVENSSKMSQEEIKINQVLMDRVKIMADVVGQRANEITKLEDIEKRQRTALELEIKRKNNELSTGEIKGLTSNLKNTSRWSGRMLSALSLDEDNAQYKDGFTKEALKEFFTKNSYGKTIDTESENILKEIFKDKDENFKISAADISNIIYNKQVQVEDDFKKKTGLSKKKVEELVKSNHEIADSYIIVEREGERVKVSIENLRDSYGNAAGAQKRFSELMINSANTVSNLIFSVNVLNSAFKTLNDPDLGFMDKFLSISMSLLTAVPALAASIKGVKEIFSLETAEIIKNTVAQVANTIAIKANIAATKDQIEEKKKAGKAIDDLTEIDDIKTWSEGTGALIGKLVQRFGPLILKIGLAAGALALFIQIFQQLRAISPEGILKSTAEQADDAAAAFNRVSTKINEVKSSIDGLENARTKIENLTEGTLEWYQAVTELNGEVLKLKNQFPDILELTQDKDTNILGFTEESLKALEEKQIQLLLASQGTKLQSDKRLLEAEYNVEKGKINLVDDFQPNYLTSNLSSEQLQAAQARGEDIPVFQNQSQTDLIDGIAQYYNAFGNGEAIFADVNETAKILAEGIYGITEKDAGFNKIVTGLSSLINENEDQIRKLAEMQERIEAYDSYIYDTKLASLGSDRTGEELGINYNEIFEQSKLDAKERFAAYGKWQDHINYSEDQVKNNQALQDFMAMQGDDVKYVANRGGKIVLSIDGKEEDFTEEQVYEALAEYEISSNLKKEAVNKIRENLGEVAKEGFDINALKDEEVFKTDNFYKMLQNKYLGKISQEDLEAEGADPEALRNTALKKADTSFNTIYSAASDFGQFEHLTELLDNIIWDEDNTRVFENMVEDFQSGEIGIKDFIFTLEKLNTQTDLSNLSKFKDIGKSLGLNDEETKIMQEYAKHIAGIAEESDIFSSELATNTEGAADLAIEITRMNKGVSTLAEGFTDWNDVLRNSSKESFEYVEALVNTKSALADVLDVESDLISNDFITENLDQIKLASEGNGEAIDALRAKMDEEIIAKVTLGQTDEFIAEIKSLDEKVQEAVPDGIEIGATIQDEDFLNAANALVEQAGMTADEANAYFAGIGYEPVYSETEVDNSMEAPNMTTTTSVAHIGWEKATIDLPDILGGEREISLPSITMKTSAKDEGNTSSDSKAKLVAFSGDGTPPKIRGMRKKADGASNNFSQRNDGGPDAKSGGGGSKTKAKQTKRSDVVDRYKEITDQLDDVSDAASDASKEMDRLYGASRLKAMEKQNSLLLKERDLLKQKRSEAEAYLKIDKLALQNQAKKAGVNLQFGADGNITNYTQEMNKLFDQLDALQKVGGDYPDEYQQKAIDELNTKIEDLKQAITLYDGTRKIIQDLDNQIQDKFNEWQDNNYNQLTYSLELKLEINDMELEKIDYYLNKFSDNFYKMAESAALMFDQIAPNKQSLEDNQAFREELEQKYTSKDKEISQADYIEGLKTVRENLYNNLEALNELDKTMLHYYEDTLSAATEELSDYTDHMEHLTGVFDHYLNLMNLLGRQKDYDAIGNFLGGKAEAVRDRLDVAKEYYNTLLEQKNDVEAKLNAAIARGDDAAAELYKEEWDAIVDAVDSAQEQVLSLTEEWAESMKAVIENNMAKIAETLEKTLTNGLGFDALMDGFDKLNTRQEEYLTKTNQIYETNKLMRTASKALDESDNSIAKQKLKNFIEETKSLQQNTKLSKYELEIQQAKYDLLLAEIALEEAQNAKSVVRLSRDNEGNFGYVYTADQDAIDDAQQGVEDAENRLYNISLEGQQKYTEKYLQAKQEMYNELTALQEAYLNGEIASEEEYERRKEEILNHYLGPEGILTTCSSLYNIAVRTDADATADYWAKDYAQMTQNTEEWNIAVNEYLDDIEVQTQSWRDVSEQANKDVENALNNSAEATENLTDESGELADQIKEEVVPAIKEELNWVAKQTEAYANQRKELLDLIEATERYLNLLEETITNESGKSNERRDYASELIVGGLTGMDEDEARDLSEQRAHKQGLSGKDFDKGVEDNMNIYYMTVNASESQKQALTESFINRKEWDGDTFKDIMGLSSGGYTGAWGPEGKLAFLHEKELVLNQNDTDNILKTVNFVRELVGLIDTQAHMASLLNLSAVSGVQTENQVLEQQVSIYAEFPNATDRNEIEEAFNNLINTASQYANRKN